MKNRKNIIIDTDIGDDIDDLLALCFALSSDDFEILGVTTSYLNTNLRARQAKKAVLLSEHKDIPVFAGVGRPLKGLHSTDVRSLFVQYTPDLLQSKFAPENDAEGSEGISAAKFINEQARKYGKNLTIACLAPLTNISKCLELDPSALKETPIVMMGGCYSKIQREWNIECDFEAAAKVFSAHLKLTCLGSDITRQVALSEKEEERLLSSQSNGLSQYRSECAKTWKKATSRPIILHDPLALYSVGTPDICRYKKKHVFIETEGIFSRGMTLPLEDLLWVNYRDSDGDQGGSCQLAVEVDAKRFKREFLRNAEQ